MSDNNQIQKQNLKKLTNLPYLYKQNTNEGDSEQRRYVPIPQSIIRKHKKQITSL